MARFYKAFPGLLEDAIEGGIAAGNLPTAKPPGLAEPSGDFRMQSLFFMNKVVICGKMW